MTSKSPSLTLLEAHNFNRWAAKNPDQLLCEDSQHYLLSTKFMFHSCRLFEKAMKFEYFKGTIQVLHNHIREEALAIREKVLRLNSSAPKNNMQNTCE